jgi:pyridoxine/pyridoxamine 5'-phosphate oxidase
MDQNVIFDFLRSRRPAVLATVHPNGAPEAALIGYGVHPDFGIVFDTFVTPRKALNLRRQPDMALVVGWEYETTVQIEGNAHEPAGVALHRAKAVYFDAWPDGKQREAWPDITYFVMRPSLVALQLLSRASYHQRGISATCSRVMMAP